MDVKVEKFVATSARDRNVKVYPKQWRIRVDGRHAGFLGWKPGSKLNLYGRFSPDEVKEIEEKVQAFVSALPEDWDVQANVPPPLPQKTSNEDEEEIVDELDE